jgi:hypothetical protein
MILCRSIVVDDDDRPKEPFSSFTLFWYIYVHICSIFSGDGQNAPLKWRVPELDSVIVACWPDVQRSMHSRLLSRRRSQHYVRHDFERLQNGVFMIYARDGFAIGPGGNARPFVPHSDRRSSPDSSWNAPFLPPTTCEPDSWINQPTRKCMMDSLASFRCGEDSYLVSTNDTYMKIIVFEQLTKQATRIRKTESERENIPPEVIRTTSITDGARSFYAENQSPSVLPNQCDKSCESIFST